MKRRLAFLLILSLCIVSFLPAAPAESPFAIRNEEYDYAPADDGTAKILKYRGNSADVVIPAELGGAPVTVIGKSAFSYNPTLESVTFPDTVTRIENHAFYNCDKLASVILPESTAYLGHHAFSACSALKSINLPVSLTEIEHSPFSYCPELVEIHISPDHPVFEVIDGVLFSKQDKRLICYPFSSRAGTYEIPQGTEILDNGVFSSCTELTHVILPNSIREIREDAFLYCTNLKEIILPTSLTSIGIAAFLNCTSLTSVVIPDSVTFIDSNAFCDCASMTDITIPESVTSFGIYIFTGCDNLTVHVRKGSAAEKHCIDNELKYVCDD